MSAIKPSEPAPERGPGMTAAERQARRRARMKQDGLTELRGVFVHPDDLPEIRAFVAKLARRRERQSRS